MTPLTDRYSRREEIANGTSHLIGAFLGVAGLSLLVVFSSILGDPWKIVSFSIYGTTLTALYSASAAYHFSNTEKWKRRFRVLDHCAIFWLIAGTYTPFALVTLRGAWGWSIFGVTWGCAILGTALTLFSLKAPRFLIASIYIAMGWMAMIAIKPLVASLSGDGMLWLVLGGLFYTFGTVFYIVQKIPYNHAIWHLFVLAGSVSHFFCLLFYVL